MKPAENTIAIKVIKPRIKMVYTDDDIKKITFMKPVYDHKRINFDTFNVWVSHFADTEGKRVEKNDVAVKVVDYMKNNGLIVVSANVSFTFTAEHFFGQADEEGCSKSVYSMFMELNIR